MLSSPPQARSAAIPRLVVMQIVLLSLLTGGASAAAPSFPYAAAASVRLDPPHQSLQVGQAATVSILIDNASDLFSVELHISFDPSKLQVRDADTETVGTQIAAGYFPDPANGVVVSNSADNSQGSIAYAATLLPLAKTPAGSGTTAVVSFLAIASGESSIRLDSVKLYTSQGQQIPSVGSNASVSIGPTSDDTEWAAPGTLPTSTPGVAATPTTPDTPATSTDSGPNGTTTPTAVAAPGLLPAPTPSAGSPPTQTRGVLDDPGFMPRSRWYFAEGSTRPPFGMWLLLQNPGVESAQVRVVFLKDDGSSSELRTNLSPTSRTSFYVNRIVPNANVAMVVEADALVLAERSMYFRADGHASVGATSPSTNWYLAEGSTAPPFETWILVQNPGGSTARVTLRYMLDGGATQTQQITVPPFSRASVYANQLLPPVAFSTQVEADQPVVVERAMYTQEGGGNATGGVTAPSQNWYMAEGSTEQGVDTWILLQNPGPNEASVTLTALMPGGRTAIFSYELPPSSRTSVYANQILPPTQFGAMVESDTPIVVERSMYFGNSHAGTHASTASPVLARTWYLAEGSTSPPFHEYLLVANPNEEAATVKVTFMKEDGYSITEHFAMAADSRLTVDVNREVPDMAVSAKVTADQPIVVERSMYFANGQGGTNVVGIPEMDRDSTRTPESR